MFNLTPKELTDAGVHPTAHDAAQVAWLLVWGAFVAGVAFGAGSWMIGVWATWGSVTGG